MKETHLSEDFRKSYNKFIEGLKLDEIYLLSANVRYLKEVDFKKRVLIKTRASAQLEILPGNAFKVIQKYSLEAKPKEENDITYLRISCEFAVIYDSKVKPTAKVFAIFKDSNLRLNTWPYFREFVHNTIARMNLPPMIAPLLKT